MSVLRRAAMQRVARRAARNILHLIDAKAKSDVEYATAEAIVPPALEGQAAIDAVVAAMVGGTATVQSPRVALTAEQAAQVRTIQQVQDYGIERDRGFVQRGRHQRSTRSDGPT